MVANRAGYVTALSAEQGGAVPGSGPDTMRQRRLLLTLLAVVAFAAYLLWSTLASQHVECSVTVAFGAAQGTGTASASTQSDAIREAQTAACGPITQGMNDRIACGRVPPVSKSCRTL